MATGVMSGSGRYVDYVDTDTGTTHLGNLFVTLGMSPNHLARAYFQMEQEGLLEKVFYNNPELNVGEFLTYFIAPDIVLFGCYRREGIGSADLCGLAWVSKQERFGNYRRGEASFCFFHNRQADSLLFGRMCLTTLFGRFALDHLYGTTPTVNRLALRYAQHLGFSMHGPIPDFGLWKGQLCDVMISHLSKERFLREAKGKG